MPGVWKFRSLGSLGLLGQGVKDSALAHLLVAHENRSLQTTRGSHGSKEAVCWQVVTTQQMSPLFPPKKQTKPDRFRRSPISRYKPLMQGKALPSHSISIFSHLLLKILSAPPLLD